ncbi:hypothetical protein ERC79_18370 [Rhodococcus sp. ABRD24]|uniref:hypothetical protein n=1 Tax=Rhodococcus sp. ABRD24 TaxID=2507582 RepID=UPI00103C19B8|nr:hypothetical protein [Rhodococcus sp. ABRD24]QBJ97687.1 hypothetical protein ERC79_18370 [Rhodococcus sp. ABRD24]
MGRIMGKGTATIVTAAVAVLTLTACSTNETSPETREKISSAVTSTEEVTSGGGFRSSIEASASSLASSIGGAWDQAKLTAFVAAFRTAYPNLASDRDDQSIETILEDTCADIDANTSEQELVTKVTQRATNGGTVPTDDQARHILQLVKATCP